MRVSVTFHGMCRVLNTWNDCHVIAERSRIFAMISRESIVFVLMQVILKYRRASQSVFRVSLRGLQCVPFFYVCLGG